MAIPQEYGVLVAGLSAGVVGGVITLWCAWLEYRQVMGERLAKESSLVRGDAQLVFDNPPGDGAGVEVEDGAAVGGNDGAGVWGRAEDPIYHSAAPDTPPFDEAV